MNEDALVANIRDLVDRVRSAPKGSDLQKAAASLFAAFMDAREDSAKAQSKLARVEELWREGKTTEEITEEMGWLNNVTTRKALSRLGLPANRKRKGD